ncbi:MAG: D-alanyl-D-alanine carboxypeptidase/D-alanyl-D-alanine-endopeptidase [Gemmatimonadota bacterium]|jgi:D-alanyl-D-alanine carboxypeptidase/D-alanyl-D-alanine-endopeptidase (penicillin-binding protein 4)
MLRYAAMGTAVAAASIVLAGCASAPARPGAGRVLSLEETIDSVTSTPPLDRTHWGIAVWDVAGRRWRARVNADRHFIPASNTKLVVGTASLGLLGPDYRYRTPVRLIGLDGDSARVLMVEGRGDPTWSARFHDSDFTVTDSIADLVAAAGVRRITGGIIIDASSFTDEPVPGTWEVGDLTGSYAPPVDALAIAEGTFRVAIAAATRPGETAVVTQLGAPGLQPLSAWIRTDTARARGRRAVDYLDRADSVRMVGTIGLGRTDTVRYSVTDPPAYAGRALENALRVRGVDIRYPLRVLRDTAESAAWSRPGPGDTVLATVVSPPLAEIVAAMLGPSQNWIAEQLVKTIGLARTGHGSWQRGIEEEETWMVEQAGINSTAFFLRDASGLSAQNLLAPSMIVRLLEYAGTQPWGDAFRNGLPAPGLEDGTLENRLAGYENRIRAKTGTITNVNSLSGYMSGGRELIFSIMTNGSGTSSAAVRRGIDRIVQAVAREGGQP